MINKSRRTLLQWTGVGGLLGTLASAGELFGAQRARSSTPSQHEASHVAPHAPDGNAGYGALDDPPLSLSPNALASVESPGSYQPSNSQPQELTLQVLERRIEVAHGRFFDAWTYNGTVPGPTIRAAEGQLLKITLINNTSQPHTLHFHGTHDVTEDGWQPVLPQTQHTYTLRAGPVGLHPYHCHMMPLARHFSKGMYGVLIVDPPQQRAPAREIVLSLCAWDLNEDGKNEIYAWNGIAGFYGRYPIRVEVGELVRVYLSNLVEYDPIASFHLHAQTFDVFHNGSVSRADAHTDVIALVQAQRSIIEFRLPNRGRYMFHPHHSYMAERGAMGWFTAV